MADRLTVVVSRDLSPNPQRLAVEDAIVAGLVADPKLQVIVIPHLYSLRPTSAAVAALRQVEGDLLVLAWLYERATRWILAQRGIHGAAGVSLLSRSERQLDAHLVTADPQGERVASRREVPSRLIWCLELRADATAEQLVGEVKRIAAPHRTDGCLRQVIRFDEPVDRRWYPVIDYSRCTNCLECIDFCLFGVYGIDSADTILVEQPDSCRSGCPACSRVCPEQAILFPRHATPSIAGALAEGKPVKMNLSELFAGTDPPLQSRTIASRERDDQLQRFKQEATGSEASEANDSQSGAEQESRRDELDDLMDALDEFDS